MPNNIKEPVPYLLLLLLAFSRKHENVRNDLPNIQQLAVLYSEHMKT